MAQIRELDDEGIWMRMLMLMMRMRMVMILNKNIFPMPKIVYFPS